MLLREFLNAVELLFAGICLGLEAAQAAGLFVLFVLCVHGLFSVGEWGAVVNDKRIDPAVSSDCKLELFRRYLDYLGFELAARNPRTNPPLHNPVPDSATY